MPERLSEAQWGDLLVHETDTFRLTIRGFAALEAELDFQTERLFRVPMDGGFHNLGTISKRAPVASALGVLIEPLVPPFNSLRKLRNDFAHGEIHELRIDRAREIGRVFRDAGIGPPEFKEVFGNPPTPRALLIAGLSLLKAALEMVGDVLYREQQDPERGQRLLAAIEESRADLQRRMAEANAEDE